MKKLLHDYADKTLYHLPPQGIKLKKKYGSRKRRKQVHIKKHANKAF